MGLQRRGAAKLGVALLVLSVLFGLSYSFYSSPEAEAQQAAATFDFYGYVKYPNGSFVNNTNVTVDVLQT